MIQKGGEGGSNSTLKVGGQHLEGRKSETKIHDSGPKGGTRVWVDSN